MDYYNKVSLYCTHSPYDECVGNARRYIEYNRPLNKP